ncbi:MAG TPA: glycosyltransferase [Steroidobacteraceae bacterium]|nr:glycosyltransferase [Steroidobacteraceae bacterium]
MITGHDVDKPTSALRVLHVIASVSRLRGGPSVSVHSMLEALRRRGITVDLVTTDDDGGSARLDVPLDRFVQVEGQNVRFFPRQTDKYAFSTPMLGWLRAHVHQYDIVHTHGLFGWPPLAAAWCARAVCVPYVMRPAGVLDTWGMRNKSRLVKALSVRLVEGPLLRSAAAVHFTTPLEQARAAELALHIRPVVLPTGMDIDVSLQEAAQPAQAPTLGEKRVILYLARIHPIKRVDVLLRAYAAMESRQATALVIAGDGDPALIGRLKELAAGLGLGNDVHWVGFAHGALKRWLLARASLFVLPSDSENFGIAVVEAMGAGLPVIVTEGCGLAEFVRRHGAGTVTDGSVGALRSALTGLLANEDQRLGMGEAGREAARRELSLDAFGARLENLYRSVLTAGAVRTPTMIPLEP